VSTQLEAELHELRAQFASLEAIVRQLKEGLASIRETRTAERLVQTAPPDPAQEMSLASSLPGFFTGNPWVEVLSRRGREEDTIAG